MGRTTIDLDDDLVARATSLTGARTESELVEIALRRPVAERSARRSLRGLRGKLEGSGDVNRWRSSRRRRSQGS